MTLGFVQVPLDFSVIDKTPFDFILGFPALETLHASLDRGHHEAKIIYDGKPITFGQEVDRSGLDEHLSLFGTDSEHFISDLDAASPESDFNDD